MQRLARISPAATCSFGGGALVKRLAFDPATINFRDAKMATAATFRRSNELACGPSGRIHVESAVGNANTHSERDGLVRLERILAKTKSISAMRQ